jgi:phage protein D
MITQPYAAISPTLDIIIDGVPVDYESLMAVEFLLSENMHDAVSFEMAGVPTRALTEYRDRPVRLTASLGGNQRQDFVGRIVDIVPTSATAGGLMNSSPFQNGKLVCMGFSYEMRGSRSRVWNDYRLKDVVEQLSMEYGFSAALPRVEQRYNMSIQDTQSDWQFLVEEVQNHGLAMTMHGTHLHIFDPYGAYSRNTSIARLTTPTATKGDFTAFPGQILDFKGRFGERNPDGRYKETVVSVLAGGTTFDVSTGSGNARFEERLVEYADTYGEAMRLAEASRKKQYDFEATVTAVGMLGTVPGGVVIVDNYQNADIDGPWYVRSIKHRIATGAFISELEIARNATSQLVTSNMAQFKAGPPPSFYNGLWGTSSRSVDEY